MDEAELMLNFLKKSQTVVIRTTKKGMFWNDQTYEWLIKESGHLLYSGPLTVEALKILDPKF